jgi:glutamate-ammonia-ligase adenylyltransferase
MNTPPSPPLPGPAGMPADPIERALAMSRYARRLTDADPIELARLKTDLHSPWDRDGMRTLLESQSAEDEAGLKKALRVLRKRVMLRLIARDLGGLADLQEVMATASTLAEIAVDFAADRLDRWLRQQYGAPVGAESGQEQNLIVVGMGKLGGGELNVSSDIDLIFAYPEEGETTGPRRIGNHEYFALLGRRLIAAIGEITEDGFVFRVDMRLRPYGDSGPLVASFAMLEDYYLTQGREWERYAWIKGRVIHGDRSGDLAALLRPFVFRKYLDFGALGSMRDLHAQIRREVARRDMADNIKLGPGGIREIEFIAQVFQLIRGGRDTALQIRPTLAVLDLLGERGLLPAQAVAELTAAYVFLRNLEHRLQYLEDAQTQTLPAGESDRAIIAAAMGFDSWESFLAVLNGHRDKTSRHFEQVFSAPQSAGEAHPLAGLWRGSPEDDEAAGQLAELGYRQPTAIWQLLKHMKTGNRYGQLPTSSRSRFDALMPPLIEVATGFANPDQTLERILRLMESVARREAYLALLLEYPQTLGQVARLCSASPWAADYLAQHPILLDEFLDNRNLLAAPDWPQLKGELKAQLDTAAGDVERQMDLMRNFKQAQVFRLLAQDLAGLLSVEALGDQLSTLADLILAETLALCWRNLRTRHRELPQFAVIGYGKLGGKELGYASDLDIIFLYDDDAPEASEVYARLAQRINTWLSSQTPAGVLYETDLRLRPNGAAGLLVSSVAAFESYQQNQAWVWEHQALTRARFCAGHGPIGEAFERIRIAVLTRQRDLAALREEVLKMRDRMHSGHPNPSAMFDLKHDRGGIVDVEFAVQYLVLAHSHVHAELTRNVGNLALLKLAGELCLVPADVAEGARTAYREFRRLQHQLRLQGGQYARVEPQAVAEHATAVIRLWEAVFHP